MDKTKVKDLMSKKLIQTSINSTVDEVALLMVENQVGSVLIYEDQRPIGIITKRDMLERILLDCKNPCDVKAGEIASKNLISISPNCTIKEALMLMYKHKVRRIPVIGKDENEIIGIITTHDLISAYNSLDIRLRNPSSSG